MWTHFWDMHSGGSSQLQWSHIYIELPQDKAIEYFKQRFHMSPDDVKCPCCGENYAVGEYPTLQSATAFSRNCAWGAEDYEERPHDEPTMAQYYLTLGQYVEKKHVLCIAKNEITPELEPLD